MNKRKFSERFCISVVMAIALACPAVSQALSIRQIQETADPAGNSPYNGAIVNCSGGIVVGRFGGSAPRIQIYDPADPNAWGGIQVKDWSVGAALFNGVAIGDWVSFVNIPVEEYRGTTFLQYDPLLSGGVAFTIQSNGNALPAPLLVNGSEILAPTQTSPQFWLVADHSAEKYESMLLKIQNDTVTELGLGKAADNYNLHSGNADVWASDYMNINRAGTYDPKVFVGQSFLSVSGMLEQYTKISPTYGWDYYQLLPRSTNDLVVPDHGDVNDDNFVGGADLTQILSNWGKTPAVWTDGDAAPYPAGDGFVGGADYTEVLTYWGTSYSPEAIPEPACLLLLSLGLGWSLARRRQ